MSNPILAKEISFTSNIECLKLTQYNDFTPQPTKIDLFYTMPEHIFFNIIKNYKNLYEIHVTKSFSRWIAWLERKQVTSVQCNIDSLYISLT